MKFVTRFAPSPTGYLHIGGARTALYSYLLAKKNKGKFILRIEDTDRSRYVEGAEKKIIQTLKMLGLNFDKGPYYQSKRLKIYQKFVKKLLASGDAYYCFCTKERLDNMRTEQEKNKQIPKYDRCCLNLSKDEIEKNLKEKVPFVIRLKLPDNRDIVFEDAVYGTVKINTRDVDDQVLIKSDGYPTYHLAVVVDDHLMGVTHIVRGEEWLPSTPKHIVLYEMLGWRVPEYVHLSLILNKDRSKLSKRQGDVATEDFLNKGYLPEAIINYIAFLGWNPKTEKEIYTMKELINDFDIPKINKAGAVFDIDKLNWINAEHVKIICKEKNKKYQGLINQIKKYLPENTKKDLIEKILKVFSSRLNFTSEIKDLSSFVFELSDYDKNILIFKKSDRNTTINGLKTSLTILKSIEESAWNEENLNQTLNDAIKEANLTPGDVFWPIRVALSGLEKSPSPAELLWLLGKKQSLERIIIAIEKLKSEGLER